MIRFIRLMHACMARAARAGWLKFSSSKLGTIGDSNHRKHLPAGHGGGLQVGAGRQLLVAGQNDTSGGLDPRHSGRNLGRGGAGRLTFCALVLRRSGSLGGAGRGNWRFWAKKAFLGKGGPFGVFAVLGVFGEF